MHLYQQQPAAVIAAWLEHANAAFTMRTYVHLSRMRWLARRRVSRELSQLGTTRALPDLVR
jgi:hypothetical protein